MKPILGIQYLRGFAALSVVWFHILHNSPDLHLPDYFGATGVDLFFVISGFIMVVTAKSSTPLRFWKLRAIRVIPLYWLVTLVAVTLAPFAHHMKGIHLSVGAIIDSLAFIPYESNDFPGHLWPIVVQGWTLNYEMFFYLLFGLSLGIRRFRLEGLTATLACLAVIGWVLKPTGALSVYTSPMLLEFVAGMWIARGFKYVTPGLIVLLPLGIALLPFNPLIGAIFAVVGSLKVRIEIKALLAMGDASYSIYLVHPFMLGALAAIWRSHSITFVAAGFLISTIGGWACYRIIERPLTDALRQKKVQAAAVL